MEGEPESKKSRLAASYPVDLAHVSSSNADWYEESLANPEQFWSDLARQRLRWIKDFDTVMDCDMNEGRISWFLGGVLNVSGEEGVARVSVCYEREVVSQRTVWTVTLKRTLTEWPSSGRRTKPSNMNLLRTSESAFLISTFAAGHWYTHLSSPQAALEFDMPSS